MNARHSLSALALSSLSVLAACSSTPRTPDDPVLVALDNKQTIETRIQAVNDAFARAVTEPDRIGVRTELTPQLWSREANPELKLAIVRGLLAEKSERSSGEIREELRLNLPLQSSRQVVSEVCAAAAARGWTEFIPAIVRTWAEPVSQIADADRVERATLLALAPSATVESTVFSVFINPPADTPATKRMRLEERYRLAAWEVLARLDPSGQERRSLLEGVAAVASGARPPFVDELLAAYRDLGLMPAYGEEVVWVRRLRAGKSAANAAWWGEAAAAVQSLSGEQRSNLALRHIEPLRWARANRPEWLSMSTAELAAQLAQRLDGRPVYEPTGNRPMGKGKISERLADALPRLSFADLVSVLVTDEALRAGGVADSLLTYAGYDSRDTKTEYGGLLQAVAADPSAGSSGGAAFIATLYAPRPGDRFDDRRFVASQDMIDASDRSLVHWHFHVAERSNSAYAGPSMEDLDYATRQGRNCVVMTSIDRDNLNVDIFMPGNIIIDLGLVAKK
jgi:hypothetical protein